MKVAIPIFGTRISPRFDCARTLILLTCQDGRIVDRSKLPFDEPRPRMRIRYLVDKGVELVLCGGIRRCDYFALNDSNITVHPGLLGDVEEIIQIFLDDALPENHPWERCHHREGAFGGRSGHRFGGSLSFSTANAPKEPPVGSAHKGGRKHATRKR